LLCWVLASIVTGRLVAVVAVRTLALIGFSLVLAGFGALVAFDADTPRWFLYADMAVLGGGMGLAMLCLLLAIQTVAPRRHLGVATSLMVFCRSLGGAVGVALLGAVFTAVLQRRLARLDLGPEVVRSLLDLQQGVVTVIAPEVRRAFEASLSSAFAAAGAIALCTVLAATRLPRRNLSDLERLHAAGDASARAAEPAA
jgi:hypothetical protein